MEVGGKGFGNGVNPPVFDYEHTLCEIDSSAGFSTTAPVSARSCALDPGGKRNRVSVERASSLIIVAA